jgi:hypothetical protein
MNRLIMLAVVSILIGGTATAQIDPDPDGIGIYFDLEAYQHSSGV